MKTILCVVLNCELLQKLKQLKYNILNYIYCKEGSTVCLFTIIGKQKYKIEQKSNTLTVKTNLPYTLPFRIINQFLSLL